MPANDTARPRTPSTDAIHGQRPRTPSAGREEKRREEKTKHTHRGSVYVHLARACLDARPTAVCV